MESEKLVKVISGSMPIYDTIPAGIYAVGTETLNPLQEDVPSS